MRMRMRSLLFFLWMMATVQVIQAAAMDDYKAGLQFYQAGQYDQSAQSFRAATVQDPQFWQAYQGLGTALLKKGDTDGAVQAYRKCLEIHPDNPPVRAIVEKYEVPLPPTESPVAVSAPPPPMDKLKADIASPSDPPVGFGLKTGLSLANVVFNTYGGQGYDPKLGFTGGLYVDFRMNNWFSIQPELFFTMKGASYSFTYYNYYYGGYNTTSSIVVTLNDNYLEIPLLLKAGLATNSDVKIDLYTGDYVAFLTGATVSAAGQNANFSYYLSGTDFGLIFGGGLEIGRFLLDIRYDLGITSIVNPTYGGYSSEVNSTFLFMTGFKIR